MQEKSELKKIIEMYVDYLMPELTPYEAALYIFLLRNSYIKSGLLETRVGKRTIAEKYGKGSRGVKTNYAHVTKLVKGLENKNCIKIGDTTREGTLYVVILPEEIPLVKEKLPTLQDLEEEDYFTSETRRKEVFGKDKWMCFYCGDKVSFENATLDHLTPQHRGGKHTKENLKTSCLVCNSIKSGKTYEEAAPFLLKSIQERRARKNN